MLLGAYRFNIDALLARLIYKWPLQSSLSSVVFVVLICITTGIIPPFWRGQAALTVQAAPESTVRVDGKSWPRTVYAGTHTIQATMPDGRMAWANVTLSAGQVLTTTLPIGLATSVRPLPVAAPGMHIQQVYYADSAWRVQSVRDAVKSPTSAAAADGLQTGKMQTVALKRTGTERLATIDTYLGLADQMTIAGRALEAIYQPNGAGGYGGPLGALQVRGWAQGDATIPISNPVTLVRFAPDGNGVLIGEQSGTGEQLSYIPAVTQRQMPAVAVPGTTTRIDWQDTGDAALVTSVDGDQTTLTLVRLRPTLAAAVIMEQTVGAGTNELVPVAWDAEHVYWVAADTTGKTALWRAGLADLLPERQRPFDAVAISVLPDGAIRSATIQGTLLIIGRDQGDVQIGEAVVADFAATPDLIGRWQGNTLLMQGVDESWLITMDEQAIRK